MGSISLPIRITFKGHLKNFEAPGSETRYLIQYFDDQTSEWYDIYGAMTTNGGELVATYTISSATIASDPNAGVLNNSIQGGAMPAFRLIEDGSGPSGIVRVFATTVYMDNASSSSMVTIDFGQLFLTAPREMEVDFYDGNPNNSFVIGAVPAPREGTDFFEAFIAAVTDPVKFIGFDPQNEEIVRVPNPSQSQIGAAGGLNELTILYDLADNAGVITATVSDVMPGNPVQTLQTQVSTLQSDLATVNASLAATQADLADAQTDLANALADLASTQAALTTAQNDLASTQAALTTAQDDLAASQANLASTQANLQTVTSERDQLVIDLATSENLVDDLQAQLAVAPQDPYPFNQVLTNIADEAETTRISLENSPYALTNLSLNLKAFVQADENGNLALQMIDANTAKGLDGSTVSTLHMDLVTQLNTSEITPGVVPALTGITESMARKLLLAAGLKLKPVYQNVNSGSPLVPGQSFKQFPDPQTELKPGDLVTVIFAKQNN